MRLHHMALRVPGDGGRDARVRFHDRLTVVTPVELLDRRELIEVLLGTLAGEPTVPGELAYTDTGGRTVVVEQDGDGRFAVAGDAPRLELPHARLGLTVHQLFDLMYLDAARLGLAGHATTEPAELTEARAALAAIDDQLQAARLARETAEALRIELLSIEEEIRNIDANRPRREYARLLLDLEKLRTEKLAQAATPAEAEADRVLAAHRALLQPIVDRWKTAAKRVNDINRRIGHRPRLDQHSMAGALALPDSVPANLDDLVDALAEAEARRAELAGGLAAMMAAHVASPSHPEVDRLARHDQDRVWAVARLAVETGRRLEHESIRAGGLAIDGARPAVVEQLETAHEAVEAAHNQIEKRRFGVMAAGGAAALGAAALAAAPVFAPLALAGAASAAYWSVLAPRQQLAVALAGEAEALGRAGVPSYLAFHLRRIEAMQDPARRADFERVAAEHRDVMHQWRLIAGDFDPAAALELEAEVRDYAASLATLGDLGSEVEAIRRRLAEDAEPAVERATQALLDAVRPFGIENPTLAADLVRQLADVARLAREQQSLEDAETDERQLRLSIEEVFTRIGLLEGPIARRIEQFEENAEAAADRVRFRAQPRLAAVVDGEIAALEERARREHRPEWGTVFTAADAREPDPDELEMRRTATATAFATASRLVPDIELIADRRSACERRVQVLEAEHGDGDEGGLPKGRMREIERALQDRLAALRQVGRLGDALPLVLDDCFRDLRPDVKWSLLDLVDRLSGGGQVVYLTDDPAVARWARRRVAAGVVGVSEWSPLLLAQSV